MTLIYLVVAVALSALGWLAYGIWRIGAISQGAQIGTRFGTALLLVALTPKMRNPKPKALS